MTTFPMMLTPPTHLIFSSLSIDPKADWITHLPNKEGTICHFKDLTHSIESSIEDSQNRFIENDDLLSLFDLKMVMDLVRPTIIQITTTSPMIECEIIQTIIKITNSMAYITSLIIPNKIAIFIEVRDEDQMGKVREVLSQMGEEIDFQWMEIPLMSKEDRNALFYQNTHSYLQALLGERQMQRNYQRSATIKQFDKEETHKELPLTQPPEFKININSIMSGEETKTTLMIKNIPNKYTQAALLEILQEKHRGKFNFLYLRMDFRNKCNVGYAFINMTKPAHIIDLYNHLSNKGWPRYKSDKVCQITWAKIQGKNNLIHKFRGSKVMLEQEDYRPKLFDMRGNEIAFPL